jgi:hypothetical protein
VGLSHGGGDRRHIEVDEFPPAGQPGARG